MKRWTDGDRVYFEDLNELVTSANLSFANPAARDAVLAGDAAPVPGTTVHMQNDGITYKYMVADEVGSWAPTPGTLISGVGIGTYQQGLSSSAVPTLVAARAVAQYSRNLNGAYVIATSRFNPQIPGIYEFGAQVAFNNPSPYDGYRAVWLCLNNSVPGSAIGSAIAGSWNQFYPSQPAPITVTVATRGVCCYLNGSTDYVTLWANHNSSVALAAGGSIYASNPGYQYYDTCLTAKYLGM
jgi:hypothetical protein